jgi:CheY-like chemotaxis protein
MTTLPHENAILVVDDDEGEVELISMAIDELKLPYRIDVARQGFAVLDHLYRRGKYAERPAGMPVLVILDNKMPMMSGVEAMREIAREGAFQAIPIVMFSASASEADMTEAYAAGVNSYVVKPMGAKQFKEAVHAIVNYWTKVNAAGNSLDD